MRSRTVTELTRPCRSCPGTTTTGRFASTRRGHPASVPRSGCHRSPRRAGAHGARTSASPERSAKGPTTGTPTATAPWLAEAAHYRCRDAGDRDGRRDAPRCLREGDEATDLTVRLGDEHVLIAQDDVGDEVERLLFRVDVRKERRCRLGGKEEPGDRIGIPASRWSDPQPFVHSRSMPVRLNQGLEVAAEGRGVSELLPPHRQTCRDGRGQRPHLRPSLERVGVEQVELAR